MALDSGKSKMAVRALAGGQLVAYWVAVKGGSCSFKSQKMEATNFELTRCGLSDIFVKES